MALLSAASHPLVALFWLFFFFFCNLAPLAFLHLAAPPPLTRKPHPPRRPGNSSKQGVGLAFSRVSQPCTHWSRFFADSKAVAGFAPHHHLRKQPLYRAHHSQKLESRAHFAAHHPTTTPHPYLLNTALIQNKSMHNQACTWHKHLRCQSIN